MIIGVGHDIVDISRVEKLIQKFGQRFLDKYFSDIEQNRAKQSVQQAGILAKRFAAKEALVKALGTGVRDGITLKDISVDNDTNGKPFISLTGGAGRTLKTLVPSGHKANIHLSLSDEPPFASAFIVIEALPDA